MNMETFKTFILIILVGLSLLLTVGLWNYQPDYDQYGAGLKYVNEADLGGDETTKKQILKPSLIIFHTEEETFGFKDPQDMQQLYESMQKWEFSDQITKDHDELPKNGERIEIFFPTQLSMAILGHIFTLDDQEQSLPSWSFQRLVFVIDLRQTKVTAHFLSVDGRKQAVFSINESKAFAVLADHLQNKGALMPYISLENTKEPIYVPKEKVDVHERTLAVIRIEPNTLVDALFKDPSLVSPNVGEAYYTDGQRGLRVLQNGNSAEYINPIHSNYDQMDLVSLLDHSIMDINDHKGWTEDYHLYELSPAENKIIYRMHYDEYPIFHQGDLSLIEQQWRNQEVYKYRRPLFRLGNSFGGSPKDLPSGEEIVFYLEHSPNYKVENISEIQLGFHLSYRTNEPYSVNLEPAWYMNYNGSWQMIHMSEEEFHMDRGER